MTSCTRLLEHRALCVPRADGVALVDPPFDEVGDWLAENLARRAAYHYDVQGRSLAELTDLARRELFEAARRWTSAYRDPPREPGSRRAPILLAGHQPEIFHPGVWFKNFALDALARRLGAVAVNLQIDNDALKEPALRVPGGTASAPRREAVPWDRPGPVVPYEEHAIRDRALFAGFGREVAARMAPWVSEAMIRQFWPMVVRRSRETNNLGASLAQARHQWEARWGVQTWEVPQSWICRTESFAWFLVHLLAHLPRLWTIHNEVVHSHRRLHRIRGTAHPVPDLARQGDWYEAPFWIWTIQDPRRRRLFVRRRREGLELSDRDRTEIFLPLRGEGSAERAVACLQESTRRGVKIRTRTLMTTLWARLFLGDLFLHGIGGAKYDRLTDALIERFFGLEPPGFLVLSATLRLPLARPGTTPEEVRRVEHRLRELEYHPERYLESRDAEPIPWVAAKRRWIQTPKTPENARRRHHEIRRANEALQPRVAPERGRLMEELAHLRRNLRAETVLGWREYGFCLHPAENLQEFFDKVLPKNV